MADSSTLGMDYEKLYISSRRERLFFLWGHTFEFSGAGNWSLAEEIAARVGAAKDVYLATNTEIYEYVTAYTSLVYSADNTKVYNPTLIPVWFEREGEIYRVDPGKTVENLKV